MKISAALLFVSVSIALVPASSVGAAAPKAAAPKSPGTSEAEKKDEPPPKIEGFEIARPEGGFLGLEIVNGTFKMSFYDAKKKAKDPDVAQAILRWNSNVKGPRENVTLNVDGKALTSPRVVRPPYNFKLFITMFKVPVEGADAVPSESYALDFQQ